MRNIFLILFIFSSPAIAGPRVNNGGGVWICTRYSEVEWIRAADFFELPVAERAREDFGSASAQEVFAAKRGAISINNPELQQLLEKWPVDFSRVIQIVPFSLNSTGDMNFVSRPQPADCNGGDIRYEQLAVYLYSNNLLIAGEIWNHPKFSPIDKAAILLHEWIYKALRESQDEQNSSRTRRIVAWLFSGKDPSVQQKKISRELRFPSRNENEAELATFSVNPRCEALVDGIVVGSWQAHRGQFGEIGSFSGSGFRFEVETSSRDGVPDRLSATEVASGWNFSQGSAVSRASYLSLKRSELRFRRGRPKSADILFWCWNQD